MAMDPRSLDLIIRHCTVAEKRLFERFDRIRPTLAEIAKEIAPTLVAGLERNIVDVADGFLRDEDRRMLTTGPMDALRRGAAGFHGNLTSPATRWFRFRLPSFMLKNGEANHEQRKLLDALTEATEWTFARSNAYSQIHKVYEHVLALGFACMLVYKNTSNPGRIVSVETLRPGTYALDVGSDGLVDTVVQRFAWTARQLVGEFGRASLPQYILDAYENPNSRFEVCCLMEPNADDEVRKATGLGADSVYRSIYFLKASNLELANRGVLRYVGFSVRPFVAPRMDVELGDVYGRGRGLDALDLARGSQSFKFDELNIVGNQSQPPMIADSELKDEGLKLYRGAVTYAHHGEQRQSLAYPVFANPPDPSGAREERADAQQEIARLFFNDAFSVIDAVKNGETGRMTATEVNAHVRDAMQRLAPVATLFDRELLDPLVETMSRYALDAAVLPAPLTEDQARMLATVNVEYVSAIHLAQKQNALGAIQATIEFADGLAKAGSPDVLDNIDADATLLRFGQLQGFPEACVVDERKVQEIRKGREAVQAEQEQIARQQAQAESLAKIGGTPVDEGHAGGELAKAIGATTEGGVG